MSLNHIHIKNFRQIDELKIEKLSRITLIGGKNGAGKTTILEGIYLAATEVNIDKFNKIELRRRQPGKVSGTSDFNQNVADIAPWSMLFSRHSDSKVIEFVYTNSESKCFELNIKHLDDISELDSSITDTNLISQLGLLTANSDTVVCETQCPVGKDHKHKTLMVAQSDGSTRQMNLNDDSLPAPHSVGAGGVDFLPSLDWGALEKLNSLFSIIRKNKTDSDAFIDILKIVEPATRDVQILEYKGRLQLHILYENGDIPLSYAGDGLLRIALYAAAILASKNSVILVDEIENGLHYSVLNDFWKAVEKACQVANTQLIASTHSAECILSALNAVDEAHFSYIRLEKNTEYGVSAVYYTADEAAQSLKTGLPIR